jgi:hypothetical protein
VVQVKRTVHGQEAPSRPLRDLRADRRIWVLMPYCRHWRDPAAGAVGTSRAGRISAHSASVALLSASLRSEITRIPPGNGSLELQPDDSLENKINQKIFETSSFASD